MATGSVESAAFKYLDEKNYNEIINIPASAVEIYCIAYGSSISNWETVSVVMLPTIGNYSVSATGKDVMVVFYINGNSKDLSIANQTNVSKYRVYYR